MNFNMLLDADGKPFRSDAKIDRAAAETMKEWMEIPSSFNPIANAFEADSLLWRQLLEKTIPMMPGLPEDIQYAIINACCIYDLHEALHSPFSFTEVD